MPQQLPHEIPVVQLFVQLANKYSIGLERNVFPQARRFHELGVVGGADKEMPELDHIDGSARGLEAPEFVGVPRGLPGESGLELIAGSRRDDRELPGAAVT